MRNDDGLQQSADWDGKLGFKKPVEEITGGKNREGDRQENIEIWYWIRNSSSAAGSCLLGRSGLNSLSWFCHLQNEGDNETYLIELSLG